MGISVSSKVEVEELGSFSPDVTLPLDITKFIFGWERGVPQSLTRFYALSKRLRQQLDRLPTKNADFPRDWAVLGMEWSQEVLEILNDMRKITQKLTETRPADLRGNFHPIEEYTSDITSTIDEFVNILKPLQCVGTGDAALLTKALNDIRSIYMFQTFLLEK